MTAARSLRDLRKALYLGRTFNDLPARTTYHGTDFQTNSGYTVPTDKMVAIPIPAQPDAIEFGTGPGKVHMGVLHVGGSRGKGKPCVAEPNSKTG